MSQYSWDTCPDPVRRQVEGLSEGLRRILSGNLIGIYLHGSLSMGCFNPNRSDLDLLVVTDRPMPVEVKRSVVELLLRLSAAPTPLEVSFLTRDQLHPWRYPPPYDLHLSEGWRRRYEDDLAAGAWRRWNQVGRTDVDLAAHITHLRDRGVALWGPPVKDVFPPVPREDYLASLLADYQDARSGILDNQIYGILNMLRVYRYLAEGRVSSKDEAGAWGMSALPPDLQPVVEAALMHYRGDSSEQVADQEALQYFVAAVDECVEALL